MSPKKIINRELSWLQFNDRVLSESTNPDNPLLERGKFISITTSNLDEFFMVRVGSLVRSVDEGSEKEDPSGMTPAEQLSVIWQEVRAQVDKQYSILRHQYLPALAQEGIHFLKPTMLHADQKQFLSDYYDQEIQPLLTPRAIDDRRPFPLLASKALHLAIILPPQNRGGATRFALVTVPSTLPRVTLLPMGVGKVRGVLLEDVIGMFVSRLFGGAKPLCCVPFRITRNADFYYNDSNATMLINEMRKNLKRRRWGKVVRLELPDHADMRVVGKLKKYLGVTENEILTVHGPLNLNYFMKQISSLEGFDHLRFTPYDCRLDARFANSNSVFDAISQGDIFLHHPYDSFDPVVRFVCEAADDPDVMAIKQTLYRVSGKSPIVAALSRAAQQGKQVTVLIEVRARFDEENNINWCQELEKAGCHVFYGVPKLKTHSKITLVVRKEESGLKRYVHLATGNYNDVTARLYTDMGLFTCDETIGRDAGTFFNTVTGYGETSPMEKLISAPNHMRKSFKDLIKQEIKNAEDGIPAAITAKMNSLCDPKLIKLLYKAADAGVHIHLIVRGICCIRKGKYENLHIRSIVGRFLEHARVFIFENGGDQKVYLASADWMPRNLDKRVELMFPIEDNSIKARIIATIQDELQDNLKAWEMKKGGKYRRVDRDGALLNVQEARILAPADGEIELHTPETIDKTEEEGI